MKSNAEGEMPEWQIPTTWRSSQDLSNEGVILYGNLVSPPCRKINTIFKYYGIKYDLQATIPAAVKAQYKKIPIVMVGAYQINDSHIITRILAHVLEGKDMNERELLIEKSTTQGLMPALEVAVLESTQSIQQCAPHLVENCCLQGVIWSLACCIPCCGISSRIKKNFPDLKSVASYGKWFAEQLGDRPFFHGDQVGVIDCAVFGILEPFGEAGNACFDDFVNADPRLKTWWQTCVVQIAQK